MSPPPQVSFFVPCLNEESNVGITLAGIVAAAVAANVTYEIVVVDDGSTDATSDVVRRFQLDNPKLPVTLKINERNKGLGKGFVDAASVATGEYYLMVCGDNTKARDSVVKILNKLGEADMVIPYFGEDDNRTRIRLIVSRSFVILVNLISGNSIRYYNGFALLKRDDVIRFHPTTSGFGSHAELITRLIDEGRSYVEVKIVNEEREGGSSTVFSIRSFFSVAHSLWNILKCRIRRMLVGKKRRA